MTVSGAIGTSGDVIALLSVGDIGTQHMDGCMELWIESECYFDICLAPRFGDCYTRCSVINTKGFPLQLAIYESKSCTGANEIHTITQGCFTHDFTHKISKAHKHCMYGALRTGSSPVTPILLYLIF